MRPALKAAKSPLLKLLKTLATAWSRFCQLMLPVNRASNLARAPSTSAATMAGSRANARIESSPWTPRPANWTRSSL